MSVLHPPPLSLFTTLPVITPLLSNFLHIPPNVREQLLTSACATWQETRRDVVRMDTVVRAPLCFHVSSNILLWRK